MLHLAKKKWIRISNGFRIAYGMIPFRFSMDSLLTMHIWQHSAKLQAIL